jgi:hypothetical protein
LEFRITGSGGVAGTQEQSFVLLLFTKEALAFSSHKNIV